MRKRENVLNPHLRMGIILKVIGGIRVIRERKRRVDEFRRLEESVMAITSEIDELRGRLKNKYKRRSALTAEIETAKRTAKRSAERSFRRVVYSLAGAADRDRARQGIRRNYALFAMDALNRDIEAKEKRVAERIAQRTEWQHLLEAERPDATREIRELSTYAKTRSPKSKDAVAYYLDADRTYTLLAQACGSGRLYYDTLKDLYRRTEGASRIAKRKLGENPGWEIVLQDAYTDVGQKWSETAECTQVEFLVDIDTLREVGYPLPHTAGKIAFSQYLFDTTVTSRAATRKGDELHALLGQAVDELAEFLLALEKDKQDKRKQRDQAAERAGLPQ